MIPHTHSLPRASSHQCLWNLLLLVHFLSRSGMNVLIHQSFSDDIDILPLDPQTYSFLLHMILLAGNDMYLFGVVRCSE